MKQITKNEATKILENLDEIEIIEATYGYLELDGMIYRNLIFCKNDKDARKILDTKVKPHKNDRLLMNSIIDKRNKYEILRINNRINRDIYLSYFIY